MPTYKLGRFFGTIDSTRRQKLEQRLSNALLEMPCVEKLNVIVWLSNSARSRLLQPEWNSEASLLLSGNHPG